MSIEIKNKVIKKKEGKKKDEGKKKEEGRAKHIRIEINKKRIDFPKKVAHISLSDSNEVAMFRKEFDIPPVSEFALKITPKTLRDLVGNPSKHQSRKDAIRNTLSDTGDKGINIAYPILVNERSPNESEVDFIPFGKPSEKILTKLFDLLDIEGFDLIILPVLSSNGQGMEWTKMATETFKNRKSDFLNDYHLSGFIPRNVTENVAISMAKYYLKNDFKSLTFDFNRRKVPEGRMRGIIDALGNDWEKIHIHATNVPHYDWYGTWRKPALPTYDLLISVYGFDSFGNLRMGMGTEPPAHNKIKEKMQRKRYRVIDTYGTYDHNGLNKILETHTINCNCPTCRKTKPIEIYNKPNTINSAEQLRIELKTHRLYSTHKEMNQINTLIDKDKYLEHIKGKKEATNELSSILINL